VSRHHELLRLICRELRVVSPNAFEHASLGHWPLDRQSVGISMLDEKYAIGSQLWPVVYHLYHRGETRDAQRHTAVTDLTPIMLREHAEFGQELRRCNHGTEFRDPGWLVAAIESDCLRVTKGGVTLVATRDELLPGKEGVQIGTEIVVRFPGHLPYTSPGYYLAIGEEGIPRVKRTPVTRIYFHVSPEGALRLMSGLTELLPGSCPTYAFKVLNHPDAFTRRDAAVLCLPRDHYFTFCDRLRELCFALAPEFRATVPGFSKKLMPGVGLAEELEAPLNEKVSFGQHRSFLVAGGIARAFLEERNTEEGRYAAIVQEFRESDLDALRPYLNSGSIDSYGVFLQSSNNCADA